MSNQNVVKEHIIYISNEKRKIELNLSELTNCIIKIQSNFKSTNTKLIDIDIDGPIDTIIFPSKCKNIDFKISYLRDIVNEPYMYLACNFNIDNVLGVLTVVSHHEFNLNHEIIITTKSFEKKPIH